MYKKLLMTMMTAFLVMGLFTGCGAGNSENQKVENSVVTEDNNNSNTAEVQAEKPSDNGKRVAKDGADMQTDDKSMPTRKLPENGTRINMHFGDTVIPGVLNDSETAKALIEMLPVTVHMNRYSHDFCGSASHLDLPYQEEAVHYGWLNGDIDYAIDAPWFTILFEDEDVSEKYGSQVNIGVIDCPIANISALDGSYDVLVELAE